MIDNASVLRRAIVFGVLSLAFVMVAPNRHGWAQGAQPELVSFSSGDLELKGFIWKPEGRGPFPAILWNHGSELRPGTADTVAPFFVSRGYIFFVPHRRGQGRSPGTYIMHQLTSVKQPSRIFVALQEEHFEDQLAALAYLKSLPDVDQSRLVVMGASFGGIQTMLAVERGAGYRVAVNCSGAAQTWSESGELRARLTVAASKATIPVFFFQAENDYDLTPNRVLSEEARKAGQSVQTKTYPAYGSSAHDGHSFCWLGVDTWGPDALAFIEANMKPK